MFVPNLTAEQSANIKHWIDTLKDNRFKQTRECLHDINGYCCLGVALELQHGGGIWELVPLTTQYGYRVTDEFQTSYLLESLLSDRDRARYGLTQMGMRALSELNDLHKLTFREIAVILETAFANNIANATNMTNDIAQPNVNR